MMKKYFLITSFCFLTLFAFSVHGQGNTGGSGSTNTGGSGPTGSLENPFRNTGNSLPELFNAIVQNILLPIGSVVAIVAFVWAGFLFVTAQGKPDKLETAKKALLYTAIGTAVLLGASVISAVITGTINSLR